MFNRPVSGYSIPKLNRPDNWNTNKEGGVVSQLVGSIGGVKISL